MQRRAAAISAAFFLVIAVGAYAYIGVAQEPNVEVDAAIEVAQGDEFQQGGTNYRLVEVTEQDDSWTAKFAWTNQSAVYTETWENNSTVTFQGSEYRVVIPDVDDPQQFSLVDSETLTFEEGAEIQYQNNTTTVEDVAPGEVVLEWTAPRDNTVSVSQGNNVTLSGTTYLAHFPFATTAGESPPVQLTTDFNRYNQEVEEQGYFHERISGLWGIVILSGSAGLLLLAVAYLPSRY